MKQRPLVWWLPLLLAAAGFIVDRLTKNFFLDHPTERYTVVTNWFWLQLHVNTKMALSLPLIPTLYYSLVGVVLLMLCAKAVQLWNQGQLAQFTCVLFILTGAISNLLDRLYYGGVVDFVAGQLGHIFNLADVMIVVSVMIWIIILWQHDRQKTVQTHG